MENALVARVYYTYSQTTKMYTINRYDKTANYDPEFGLRMDIILSNTTENLDILVVNEGKSGFFSSKSKKYGTATITIDESKVGEGYPTEFNKWSGKDRWSLRPPFIFRVPIFKEKGVFSFDEYVIHEFFGHGYGYFYLFGTDKWGKTSLSDRETNAVEITNYYREKNNISKYIRIYYDVTMPGVELDFPGAWRRGKIVK